MNNTPLKDRKLLYRALCAMIPYETKVQTFFQTTESLKEIKTVFFLSAYKMETMRYWAEGNQSRYLYKPYLFPLSSMTKNQMNDFYATIRPVVEESFDEYFIRKRRRNRTPTEGDPITLKSVNCDVTSVNWMLEHHFDIYGLIEKGLAIDATGKGIY